MAKRKRYLFVCTNTRVPGTSKGSCGTRGSEALHAALKAEVATRGMAPLEVRVCTSSCTDVCWAGPIVYVSPDNVFYGRVTEADVKELIDAVEQGTTLGRLLLPATDFEMTTAAAMLPEVTKS